MVITTWYHMDTATALSVLEDAINRCRNEDMRTAEVFAALDCLGARANRQWPFDQFRSALDRTGPGVVDAEGRWQVAHASLNAIKLAVNHKRKGA